MTKDVKTVIGLVSKINLQADPLGMAVGFGSDSSREDEAFHLLPAEALRYQQFSANSAGANECGEWTDTRIAEIYLRTVMVEHNQCGLYQRGQVLCQGGSRAKAVIEPDQEGLPSSGLSVRRLPWCSKLYKAMHCKAGLQLYTFIFLSDITLSLGVIMLIMLPSFAVCSGDVTTKSYM